MSFKRVSPQALAVVGYRGSSIETLRNASFFTKKEKEAKERNIGREGLWKLPQLWKSAERLADSHSCLEKPASFSTVTTGPTAITLTSNTC